MKKLILPLFLIGTLLSGCTGKSAVADYRVVPLPQDVVLSDEANFTLTANTSIVCSGDEVMQRNAHLLAEYIKEKTALDLAVTADALPGAITLALDAAIDNPEGYRLVVNADGVTITGASPAGVFYGMQTLRKALPVVKGGAVVLPAVTVTDYPRFSYRGAHLDVSRHFFTVDSVKRFIDMLALHNMNRFHWHLTDDQGWRLGLKK